MAAGAGGQQQLVGGNENPDLALLLQVYEASANNPQDHFKIPETSVVIGQK